MKTQERQRLVDARNREVNTNKQEARIARRIYDATYYAAHKKRCLLAGDTYYAGHKEEQRANQRKRNAALRLAVFDAYGGPRCACCGETLVEGLSIDHINGDGASHRKTTRAKGGTALYHWLKMHDYPPGYQVLCSTCNWAKGRGDHCPHQDAWA